MPSRDSDKVLATYVPELGAAEVTRPLRDLDGRQVVLGVPVRLPPSRAGQRHYPGLFWSATNNGHLVYESLLELAWLWLADFDPEVSAIAAQPLRLVGVAPARTRYPDFLVVGPSGDTKVIDVKPEALLSKPEVAASLAWTSEVIREKGWGYEVWTGADPVVLRNVRLLAAARRSSVVPLEAANEAAAACGDGSTIGAVEDSLNGSDLPCPPRAAVLGALWRGLLVCDLRQPLAAATWVEAA